MFKRTLVLTAVSTFALLAPAGAMAQDLADPDSTAQGDVSVTIYNDDQALVQDVRQLSIASGRSPKLSRRMPCSHIPLVWL